MTDKELVRLLKKDPEKGLAAVVARYTAYVLKIAYTRLGSVCSREDIEEAASDIFLKFFEYSKKAEKLESVRGPLSLIAGRHCISLFRQHCGRGEELRLEDVPELSQTAPSPEDAACSPLAEALHSLGRQDEEIFIRRYFFGQTSAEIGEELDMKPNTVDKRISRGLVRLREKLKEDGT